MRQGAGAEMILATFRRSPMWRTGAPVEQRFTQFIREFAEYDTEGTEPPEPAPPEDLSGEPPIDLTTYVDQGEGETTP